MYKIFYEIDFHRLLGGILKFMSFLVDSYTVVRHISGKECKVLVHIKQRDTAKGQITRSPEVCRMSKLLDKMYVEDT